METIDLNLDNYELIDLLNLFNIKYDFDEKDLKNAKKIVLQTHPDKCNLDKEYFLFFSKAYKVLYSIYEFRVKGKGSTEYLLDESTDGEIVKNLTKSRDFNKVFNELFDKYNIRNEDFNTGYGEWLKSDEDIDTTETTRANMNETFQNKKLIASNALAKQNVREINSNVYTDLLGNAPDDYSSGLFSSLVYDDLRNAHRENVIPVTEKDMGRTFKNQEEMRLYRANQEITPYSLTESKNIMQDKRDKELRTDTERAYTLAKQDELYKEVNAKIMSNLYKLTDK